MRISSLVAGSLLLAGALAMQEACADVYTWLDAAGRVNVSNLAPPEGARVKSVVRTKVPKADPVADSARQNQVAALSRRVRELESEVDAARQQSAPLPPAPPVVYQIFQPPSAPVVSAEAMVTYAAPAPSLGSYGCDLSWAGCALWWGPAFVTNSFIGRPTRFHHFNKFNRGGFASRPPMRLPGFRATVH